MSWAVLRRAFSSGAVAHDYLFYFARPVLASRRRGTLTPSAVLYFNRRCRLARVCAWTWTWGVRRMCRLANLVVRSGTAGVPWPTCRVCRHVASCRVCARGTSNPE